MLLQLFIVWNWTRVTLALWNAAQWKPTFQSSDFSIESSHKAVDGEKQNDALSESCARTQSTELAWWMVDLQGLYSVKKVVITRRKDPDFIKLQKFRIDFFENDPRHHSNFPNITGQVCVTKGKGGLHVGDTTLKCKQIIVGRFARLIWQPGYKESLSIREFEVLVDEVHSRSIRYDKFIGQRATNKAFLTLTTDALWKCGWECSHRRDKQLCTAFNWAPERRECHLLSVDSRSNVTKIMDNDWVFFEISK